jgi:hypothetical protein
MCCHSGINSAAAYPTQKASTERSISIPWDRRICACRYNGVPGVFTDQHVRHQRLGRQPGADQAFRCWRLDDSAGTNAATVLRTAGDENTVLRRDDVEPLRFLLANHMHPVAAAGTRCCLRFDHHLDPRQVRRQRFTLPGLGPCAPRLTSFHRGRCRRGDFLFLQNELQLLVVEPLRMAAVLRALELPNDMVHPLDAAEQFVTFGDQRECRGP